MKFQANIVILIVIALVAVMVMTFLPAINSGNVITAKSFLEDKGYIVLSSGEFNLLAKEATAYDATIHAQDAVTAAQIAAAKVDLFNSAEVFLFPDNTNTVVTLTAGATNTFGNWTEVKDGDNVTFSSKFTSFAGYINDMYIYDHSAVDKLYLLELAYGVNKNMLARVMYHTSFIEMAPIKSRRVPAGETIYYRLMCSGISNATAKVGFRYFYE